MRKNYFVHPTSIVERGAKIGEGAQIWHFCHIREGAEIGKNCKLGQNVFIDCKVRIGNRVKIANNVSIYRKVILENNVFCGPSAVFTNVINPRSPYPRKLSEYGKTLVREGATIGANATIVCGHTLGKYAFIGAGSVVTKDVPDYGLVYGNPAQLKGWMCECGQKLVFDGKETTCKKCDRIYRKDGSKVFETKRKKI